MNKLKYILILLFAFTTTVGIAQENAKPKSVVWNGYSQLRFTSNFNDVNSFAMRRMKLWLHSTPNFNEHWGFKVQTTLTSLQTEEFVLQDVEAIYRDKQFKINIGQFVPQFSLQRFQSDAIVPLTEREMVIKKLIPNGTLGGRDIGVQGNFQSHDKKLETWVGVFNGYGIKEYRFDNSGILLTHKTAVHVFHNQLTAGYSLMYRKADKLKLSAVLPDSVSFSGNDFRENVFALYQTQKFSVQGEYLWASLNGKVADGYYLLAKMNLGKEQLVASWSQYSDLIDNTADSPIVHVGFNHLFDSDKLKIMLDNEFQIDAGNIQDYFSVVQFQLFFN